MTLLNCAGSSRFSLLPSPLLPLLLQLPRLLLSGSLLPHQLLGSWNILSGAFNSPQKHPGWGNLLPMQMSTTPPPPQSYHRDLLHKADLRPPPHQDSHLSREVKALFCLKPRVQNNKTWIRKYLFQKAPESISGRESPSYSWVVRYVLNLSQFINEYVFYSISRFDPTGLVTQQTCLLGRRPSNQNVLSW